MSYYEPDEQYFEPSEADLVFQDYKEKMVDLVKSDIKTHYDSVEKENTYLKETNEKLRKEFNELKKKSENQFNIDTKAEFMQDIFKYISKDNIEKLIKLAYTPDFHEKAQFDGDAPVWFESVVNYYSNKDKVIEIFKACGVDVPKYANDFRLPFDWNKEEIDVFFSTIYNHYNCNGCTYEDNIGFWYREAARFNFDPIQNCKHNYSEIPWQFVLRNKILNSPDYCIKMANAINKGNHGTYFMKIMDYQTLDKDNLKAFVNALDITKGNDSIYNFVVNHLDLIDDNKKVKKLYDILNLESWGCSSTLEHFPKEYIIKYIKGKHSGSKEMITKTKKLTKQEKLELMADYI